MPAPPPAHKPTPAKSATRIVLLLAVLVVVGVAGYFAFRPEVPSPEPAPVASIPTAPVSPVPAIKKHIYSETSDPKADIAAALVKAKKEHKRVIVDFGGDWCGDCQVLDIYFHQAPNDELLEKNFVLVHVWIGHIDTNLDIPDKYGVAIHKGVPALAVLNANGSVVYAQQLGEFENMRTMEASSVTEFLDKWKA